MASTETYPEYQERLPGWPAISSTAPAVAAAEYVAPSRSHAEKFVWLVVCPSLVTEQTADVNVSPEAA